MKASIITFRKRQYSLIDEIVTSCINYINNNTVGTPIKISDIKHDEIVDYEGIHHSKLSTMQVDVEINGTVYNLFTIDIPQLVDDNFFILNETTYAPAIYIEEPPICFRKSSATMYAVINPLTFYKDRVVFLNYNFSIIDMLNILADNPSDAEVYMRLTESGHKTKNVSVEESIKNIASVLNIEAKDRDQIISKLDSLFFDDYTKSLYKHWYGLDDASCSLKNLIKIGVEIFDDEYQNDEKFIEITRKRAVFIERYLQPIFNSVRYHVISNCLSNYNSNITHNIKGSIFNLKRDEIIKHYRQALNSKFICDTINCYTNMIIYKAQMLSPGVKVPPSILSYIHPSFKGRVCPINTSEDEPGKVVYLVPSLQIDDFGRIY